MDKIQYIKYHLARPAVYCTILLSVLWLAFLFLMPIEVVRITFSLIAGWQVGRWLRDFYEHMKAKE